jgi:phage I-like protein
MAGMKSNHTNNSISYAACSSALPSDGEVQLLPAGDFRARDGRPQGIPGWKINAKSAGLIIAGLSALANPLVVDYEHQTQRAVENGQPAPAAGWINGKDVTWREGAGLFAPVKWTARAQLHIDAQEYKFLSPVIAYDRNTGEIKNIISVALTNLAAIDGMNEVSARLNASLTQQETPAMNKLLAALGLTEDASEESALTALSAITAGHATSIAELKAASPDPAKFVPVKVMSDLQAEVATLRSEKIGREVDGVVTAALTAGKLLPPQEKWARDLGAKDIAALNQYLDTASPIAALSGTQTGGKLAGGKPDPNELSEAELDLCTKMGVKPADYKKTKAATAVAA